MVQVISLFKKIGENLEIKIGNSEFRIRAWIPTSQIYSLKKYELHKSNIFRQLGTYPISKWNCVTLTWELFRMFDFLVFSLLALA